MSRAAANSGHPTVDRTHAVATSSHTTADRPRRTAPPALAFRRTPLHSPSPLTLSSPGAPATPSPRLPTPEPELIFGPSAFGGDLP